MVSPRQTLRIGAAVVGVIALMIVTIFGAIWVSHIEGNKAAAAYPKCQGQHSVHKVIIRDDKVLPQHTDGKRCDTLVITNLDDKDRIMAFGPHEDHVAYDGVSERYLSQNGTFKVTLVQPGNFRFHDHTDDVVQGTFTVSGAE